MESYPYPVKEGQQLTLTRPNFCSAATQKEKNREAHLNYQASAYNGETSITLQDKTKSKYNKQKHAFLTKKYI